MHTDLTLQEADVVTAALEQFRTKPTLGFSDCLVLENARKSGHLPLGTFDRQLGKAGRSSATRLVNAFRRQSARLLRCHIRDDAALIEAFAH